MKRRISLLLIVVILINLFAACSGSTSSFGDGLSRAVGKSLELVVSGKKQKAEIETGEDTTLSYEQMHYAHYESDNFAEFTEPFYEMSKNGGTTEAFNLADEKAINELNYIFTLKTLIEIKYNRDPSDTYNSAELTHSEKIWTGSHDKYFTAIAQLAKSNNKNVMTDRYTEAEISVFAAYEPVSDESFKASDKERELLNRYYELIAADSPDYDEISDLFIELVNVRKGSFNKEKYGTFAEYAYESLYSKVYSPADGEKIWDFAKTHFAPIIKKHENDYYSAMSTLVRKAGKNVTEQELLDSLNIVASNLSPKANDAYKFFVQNKLFDLEKMPSKVNLSYTIPLYYYKIPFIFQKAEGNVLDKMTLIHEFGHFLNFYYAPSDLIYGLSDNDLSELQSQGLEMIATAHYKEIFGKFANAALTFKLLDFAQSVVDGAMYDEFLQKVYAEESLTKEKIIEIYKSIYTQYGYTPYNGYEYEWAGLTHNFESPFYYISYCVSAIPSLELYSKLLNSPEDAKATLNSILEMDTENYYFADALKDAGLKDVFDENSFITAAVAVTEGIKKAGLE
ncbi:MAG: M3 family oligoendopeptidase [Ruminococcaceae bacterium]|nr:M3 family oligoendopeptidase [Oscillospiraceae bacterium]